MKSGEIRVWDPLLRVLHWSLVLLCGAAWVTAEHTEQAHEAFGIAIAAIVGIRLLWGFIGSRYARFADFVRPPREALAYLRNLLTGRSPHYAGHNPAGGLSAIALLVTMLFVAASGWAAVHGPLAGAHWLEEAHEIAAGALGALVAVHLIGVVVSSIAGRENLVRAMLTGRKRAP